jgi:hypothetical protein
MKELSSVFKCFERLFRHGRCKIHFNMESSIQGRGLCLTACQLYLQDNNAGGIPNYGWARLRASSLYSWSHSKRRNALPRQAESEMLLAVLSEMASDEMPPDDKVDLRASVKALDKALQFDDLPISDSRHSIDSVKDDRSDRESTISLSGRYSSSSEATKTIPGMSFRNNFSPQ